MWVGVGYVCVSEYMYVHTGLVCYITEDLSPENKSRDGHQ